MASVKIFSLVVRTLAKPIANTVKAQATDRSGIFVSELLRLEARMRLGLLNEEAKNIKPLNDTRAVQNGATFLAESFLFAVAAGLVLGETYRSSRKESKRRDDVRERIENLEEEVKRYKEVIDGGEKGLADGLDEMRIRTQNLDNILSTVITNGLKAGWLELGHTELATQSTSEPHPPSTGGGILPLIDPSAFRQAIHHSSDIDQGRPTNPEKSLASPPGDQKIQQSPAIGAE